MVGGTPASSTTKTGRHDIADILLKVALNKSLSLAAAGRVHSFFLIYTAGREPLLLVIVMSVNLT
jgi:hypothetical protein